MRPLHFFFAVALFAFGCSKDTSDDPAEDDNNNSAKSRTDLVVNGVIESELWIMKSGKAESYADGNEYRHHFEMVDSLATDSCMQEPHKELNRQVLFTLSTSKPVLEPLSGNFDNLDEISSVTFYQNVNNSFKNIFAFDGFIDIESVDTTSRLIKGYLQVYSSEENNVEGKFTVKYCNF